MLNFTNFKLFLKKTNTHHPLFHFFLIILLTVNVMKYYDADALLISTVMFINFVIYCSVIGILSLACDGNPYDKPKANYVGILFNETNKNQEITYFKTYLGAWFSVRFQYWWLANFTNETSKHFSYDVRKYTYRDYPNVISTM